MGGVEHGVGIAIATEKALKTDKVRRTGLSDEHRTDAAFLNEPDAAKNERSHHDLANLSGADHQGSHMGGIEWQRGAAFGTGASRC